MRKNENSHPHGGCSRAVILMPQATPEYHGCIPSSGRRMIRRLPLQRETTLLAGSVVSQERQDDVTVSLLPSYITYQPGGSPSVAVGDNAYESRAEGCASGEPVTRDTGKQATQRRRRQRTTNRTAPEPSSERGSSNKTGNTLQILDAGDMETPGIPIRERHP